MIANGTNRRSICSFHDVTTIPAFPLGYFFSFKYFAAIQVFKQCSVSHFMFLFDFSYFSEQFGKFVKAFSISIFGKGLVQEINKLPDEAGMNITIQRYLTPSGQDINKKGITPDVVVELKEEHVKAKDDVQLKKAIEVLEQMSCLVQRNGY